jgi:dipeptidyl aminopeptidase/acylaminoacyl peptidase
MPATGGPARKMAVTFNRQPHIIDWSPDSQSLLFDELYKTTRVAYNLPINGGSPKIITPSNGLWQYPSINKAGDLMAFTFQDFNTPPVVVTYSLKNQQTRRLSSINDDFAKMKHAESEVISWKSKDGKYTIEGLLTYPMNYQKGRKYPLILNIHGGPAGSFIQAYTGASSVFPVQVWAEEGYVTLRPNPRGSGGYGGDFRIANYGDWGFGDYEDIMAGVDDLIAKNIVHPDSLCVTGLSYGGYMTSWIITKTNRFKAAAVDAGVTDLISFTTTTDIPDFIPQYFGCEMWEKPDVYMKHSAMFQIKNVKTPTLVLHGEVDTRVPTSQGQELYGALKRLGVTTELVLYPRTQHGVSEPKFMLDYAVRTLDWFHKYLKRQ